MYWWLNAFASFVMGALFTGILIPKILLISFRRKLFDVPDGRKIHTSSVPRLGGMAFLPVIIFSFALLIGVQLLYNSLEIIAFLQSNALNLSFSLCGLMLLWIVGLADDLVGVKYKAKFAVQIIAACMVITGGLSVNNLHGLFSITDIPFWAAWPTTLIVIVFIINSINLIDGIDGLASGLTSIAMLFYGVVFYCCHDYIFSMLSFATLGVLVPFFYFNVFGRIDRQKKIFMGDSGSLTIGMIISIMAIRMMQNNIAPTGFIGEINMTVVALAPLIIPAFDVVRVYVYRIRIGANPFLADKNHIHHKLLALGMSQRTAMVSILISSCLITLINIIASIYININIILISDIILAFLIYNLISRKLNTIHHPIS